MRSEFAAFVCPATDTDPQTFVVGRLSHRCNPFILLTLVFPKTFPHLRVRDVINSRFVVLQREANIVDQFHWWCVLISEPWCAPVMSAFWLCLGQGYVFTWESTATETTTTVTTGFLVSVDPLYLLILHAMHCVVTELKLRHLLKWRRLDRCFWCRFKLCQIVSIRVDTISFRSYTFLDCTILTSIATMQHGRHLV